MEAHTRNLKKLLEAPSQYQVPLFQRPYVWQEEENWLPLWEDIETLLDKNLYQKKTHPHFLGAVVFEQVANQSGSVQVRLVISNNGVRFTSHPLVARHADRRPLSVPTIYHKRLPNACQRYI
ncbi:DUF262 domain-containing protein [Xanthomonas campestris]|uniref:DUF262 domain-containing protein n=1 Tax=Xanthomonas campestris pv. papavericola TaxID=487881 RepID=A0AAJ3CFU3_XANCA|nr:DUF262 domain-containing protein [Xanthomonas campestris]MEC3889535.1 DUF262 domain-containing protein [Xanthomonas campestris pv. papavericola]